MKTAVRALKADGVWQMGVLFLLTALMFVVMTSRVHAGDFSTALSKTLAEVPAGADVAGGGNASVASPEFSTRNPAVIAVEPKEDFKYGASGTYGLISFKGGSTINIFSTSGTAKLPVGVIQLTLSDANSNTASMGEFGDDKLKFNSLPSVGLQYGLSVRKNLLINDDSLYLGASYEYSQSKITLAVDPDAFTTKSSAHAVGAGMLYRIAKKVNLGASFDHSWDSADDFVNGDFDATTKTQTNKLRLGASWQVFPLTFVAADYQHLYLSGNENADQYFAGFEQYLIKEVLAVYGGYANGGTTAGLGVYLKHGGINIAYMNRAFRQMDAFLGKSQMLMFSVYGNF